eukprot:834526-Pyramimonas_sp.AAC.1
MAPGPDSGPHGAENMRTGGGRGAEQLTSSDIWHLGTRASMLVSVVACSGRELAAVEASGGAFSLGHPIAHPPTISSQRFSSLLPPPSSSSSSSSSSFSSSSSASSEYQYYYSHSHY